MSNDISFYFGTYLEIKVKKVKRVVHYWACKNNHRESFSTLFPPQFKFCGICGEPIEAQEETIAEYPTRIINDLLGKEWKDTFLAVITPSSLYQTGIIIAAGNTDADIITALKNSEKVESVTIKAGYVFNEEY